MSVRGHPSKVGAGSIGLAVSIFALVIAGGATAGLAVANATASSDHQMSQQSQRALADGVITRREDLAAFTRFAACMRLAGHRIQQDAGIQMNVVPDDTLNSAALTSAADDRCLRTQYQQIDDVWQSEVEAGTQAAKSISTCIRGLDKVPVATLSKRTSQYEHLGGEWQYCEYVG